MLEQAAPIFALILAVGVVVGDEIGTVPPLPPPGTIFENVTLTANDTAVNATGLQPCVVPDSDMVPADIHPCVLGGEDARIRDFPWQVSLRVNNRHICGGSILNKSWILTAAHCLNDGVEARVVSVKIGSSWKDLYGRVHRANRTFVHPGFDQESYTNDVALVLLRTPIKFTVNVQPVPLTREEPVVGTNLTVTGWGDLEEDGYDSDELQVVSVPVVKRSKCKRNYNRRQMDVDDTMFCAGAPDKDACQGDSGGPIVNSERMQVGVVSWGAGCGRARFPGVYSNLAHPGIRSWIRETAGL